MHTVFQNYFALDVQFFFGRKITGIIIGRSSKRLETVMSLVLIVLNMNPPFVCTYQIFVSIVSMLTSD